MENDIFSAALPVANQNVMSLEEVSSHILSGPVHHDALGTNSERHMMAGYPMFSALQEEGLRNLHINNEGSGVNPEVVASRYTSLTCNPFTNDDLHEHFMDNSLSATSITNLLSMSTNVPGNISSAIPSVADLPTDEIRSFFSNNSSSNFNAALSASQNCAYGAQDDVEYLAPKRDLNMDGQNLRWDCNEVAAHQLLLGRAMTSVRPSYHVLSSADATWLPSKTAPNSGDQFTYCTPSNELSLTLGSSQLSIMNIPSIPDQCSEISCSGITQATSKDNRCQDAPEMHDHHLLRRPINDIALGMGLEMRHTFCGSDDLSLDCGSSSHIHFSNMLLTSRYLHVAQQILAEVTSYALENHAERDDLLEGIGNEGRGTFSSACYGEKGTSPADADELRYPSWEPKSQGHMDLLLQRHAPKTKKTELITMLQMIDQGFGKCMEQIQNVANAFREATNSGPSLLPGRFALHTISVFYKALRERITAQILVVSQHLGSEYLFEKEKSFESSFIQKQWALQQLRRNDQQSWRPQRGLPEKSVAVLRAWMFQNFLHPYPKDSEKQLLAIKSGLTRSQVSNWFINARVRLWKPMIEEMYSEISRKNRGGEEGTAGERRNDANSGSQRARMN